MHDERAVRMGGTFCLRGFRAAYFDSENTSIAQLLGTACLSMSCSAHLLFSCEWVYHVCVYPENEPKGKFMKKIFIIGGMGAGKSTATKALVAQGLPFIDLDKIGHEILTWDTVKEDMVEAFGEDVLDENGEIDRHIVAERAFVSEDETRKLNAITMPRIEELYYDKTTKMACDYNFCVVEQSVFKSRTMSIANDADVVIAVVAPFDLRVERAVAAGWDEQDVRNRMARQITDAERIESADVVFSNTGTQEDLARDVNFWFQGYKMGLAAR